MSQLVEDTTRSLRRGRVTVAIMQISSSSLSCDHETRKKNDVASSICKDAVVDSDESGGRRTKMTVLFGPITSCILTS